MKRHVRPCVWALLLALALQPTAARAASDEAAPNHVHDEAQSRGETLTLAGALALVLARNPALAAAAGRRSAQKAAVEQAGLWPNPELSFEMENVAGSGPNKGTRNAETTIGLSQLIELGGKRGARIKHARRLEESASWDYEIRRAEILARAAQAFAEVLGFQEHVEHAGEAVELVERYAKTAEERVRVGAASPAEALQARIALHEARLELDSGHRSLAAARRALAGLWGEEEPGFVRAVGDLSRIPQNLPPLETLLARIETSPELQRWRAELEARRARVTLEGARAWPDFTVSGGYRYLAASDSNAFVFGASVPLPLTSRNQGARVESARLLQAADAEREAVQSDFEAQLAHLYAELENTHALALAVRDAMLPDARRAFEIISDGYRRGRFSLIEVMDSQRTLFAIIERYHLTLVAFHQVVAEIERITGAPLDGAAQPEPSEGGRP